MPHLRHSSFINRSDPRPDGRGYEWRPGGPHSVNMRLAWWSRRYRSGFWHADPSQRVRSPAMRESQSRALRRWSCDFSKDFCRENSANKEGWETSQRRKPHPFQKSRRPDCPSSDALTLQADAS